MRLKLLRERKPLECTSRRPRLALPCSRTPTTPPPCVLFGGLLFQPLAESARHHHQFSDLRINYYYDSITKRSTKSTRSSSVSSILPDPISTYLSEFREGIVDEINGRR
jgi:hypothetical protein